jgi:hypothetical protein
VNSAFEIQATVAEVKILNQLERASRLFASAPMASDLSNSSNDTLAIQGTSVYETSSGGGADLKERGHAVLQQPVEGLVE